jgi:hypothetical protein
LVKFSHEEKSIPSMNDQVNCMDMLTNIHSVPLYSVVGDNSEMYVVFFTSEIRWVVKRSPDSEDFLQI